MKDVKIKLGCISCGTCERICPKVFKVDGVCEVITREFASYGWTMLFLVILIRPLADVFPDFGVLRTLVSMRREFGIFSGILILNHFFGFLVQANMPILASFKESWMWDYKGIYFWSDLCLSCWMRKFFVLCCDCRCFLGVVSVEN